MRLILADLQVVAGMQSDRPLVESIFFGGGTPSLMSAGATEAILTAVSGLWPIAPDAEITLEANPNSVEQTRFRGYRAAGVNRTSIGVQSFDDRSLIFLGRLHSASEARRAVALATEIFPRVNFDLIYARPGQTTSSWEKELEVAFEYKTEHLSLYQLTIEQGTAFATLHRQGRLVLPDDDIAVELYEFDSAEMQGGRTELLRGLELRCTRKGKPAQSAVLEIWRLCRNWPGRSWATDAGWAPVLNRIGTASGKMGFTGDFRRAGIFLRRIEFGRCGTRAFADEYEDQRRHGPRAIWGKMGNSTIH